MSDIPSWREFANCKNSDTLTFFPLSVTLSNQSEVNSALSLCDNCSVAANCLMFAFNEDMYGIWGRTTRQQRLAYLKNRSSVDPLTIEECQDYYDHLRSNNIYPSSRNSNVTVKYHLDHSND